MKVRIVIKVDPPGTLFPAPPADVADLFAELSTGELLGLLGAIAKHLATRGIAIEERRN